MKRIVCLLLSFLLMLTVLTSCDILNSALDKLQGTTTEPEVTTAQPEVTTTQPEVTTTQPEVTTAQPEVTTTESGITPPEPEINYGTLNNPVSTTYAHSVCTTLAEGESSANPFYVRGTVTQIGTTGSYYQNVYFTDGDTEMLIYTINMPDGIDGFEVGDTITAYGYIKNYYGTIEMATYNSDIAIYVYVVKVESGNPDQGEVTTPEPEVTTPEPEVTTPEPEINYGTLNNPVSTTYAHSVCSILAEGESSANPFYVRGTVTQIGTTGSYYQNVYFTDGDTEMLIYTINMPDGIDSFEVGDTITAYGHIKNYYGTIEMATYNKTVYVYVVKVESAGGNQGGSDTSDHLYTNFTTDEKERFNDYFGFTIPFIPNDEYYVKEYTLEDEIGLNFYTYGNTASEFSAYRALFSSYTYDGSEVDEHGDMWYYYSKGDVYIDMAYYAVEEDNYVVDVYVYIIGENSGDTGENNPSDHLYTDFTADEKALFRSIGLVIPFIPNSDYYVEEYSLENEAGVNFYTFGNTLAEFNAYHSLFSSYTYEGSDEDEYGDTWYFYSKGDVCIDIAYYYEQGDYVVDVYVYIFSDGGNDDNWGDDDWWGDDNWGDDDANIITNEGKGLPEDKDGIYDVDFTKGNYVQNVTDQGYYIDGCPTVGSPAVLVIPVEFIDVTAASKGYSIENIQKIFTGKDLSYYSVHDYFFISSYQKLDLDITVVDSWFRPKYDSTYYENATYDYYGDEVAIGDQLILDEALAYLSTFMDLSKFDSDNNGTIDAVVMVNALDIGDVDFRWAYRYWNLYTDDEGYYYEYDSVSANDYIWISYEFMFEKYDENGDVDYYPTNPLNPYTFIHEFGHVLGADDYYDTEYIEHPLGGYDMMDSMAGDHNPYSKFNFGWITTSKLIVTDNTVTVNLEAFAKNGDTIILANNWDESLGAYQEYYVIMYYTATDLNGGEGGYFDRDGILVYHVNASLFAEDYDGETYYDVYNTNTSAGVEGGTEDNLIEFVLSGEGHYTYVAGDTLPTLTDDFGDTLGYTFVVDAITEESATITFTKK